ncbi:MAG: hypothetical protein KAR39_03715 [Thermoplasmata archaeon]|nr:hypothetical protein [Thermoplasmata archaeon]
MPPDADEKVQSTSKTPSLWDVLELPIKIQGSDRMPAFDIGGILVQVSALLGSILGILYSAFQLRMDSGFLSSLLIFGVATFLTLVSLVSVYSIFVYREIIRRKGEYEDGVRQVATSLGVKLGPFDHDKPLNPQVLRKFEEGTHAKEVRDWIGYHRSQQIQDVLAFYMRHTHERVMLITAALVFPSLAALPLTPWISLLAPLAIGLMAYVTLFSLLAVYETLTFIFATLKIVNDVWIVLYSVTDGDEKYTLIAPALGERHYIPH